MIQLAEMGDPRASDPAHHAAAVTPSDIDDLAMASTVGWHPIRVTRVWGTGTTASDIVAVWR